MPARSSPAPRPRAVDQAVRPELELRRHHRRVQLQRDLGRRRRAGRRLAVRPLRTQAHLPVGPAALRVRPAVDHLRRSAPWMLVFGYVLAGLAVGADVPASWTLIAETAPDDARGKMAGVAQVLWMMGPVVVLLAGVRAVRARRARHPDRLRPPVRAGARAVGDAPRDARVARCGARRARRRASRSRASASCCAPLLPPPAAVPDRHVRPVEPDGRHERLLSAVHPAHGRRAEPGHERRACRRAASCSSASAWRSSSCRSSTGSNQKRLFMVARGAADLRAAAVRRLPAHARGGDRLRRAARHRRRLRPAAVLPALERRDVPDRSCAAPRRA